MNRSKTANENAQCVTDHQPDKVLKCKICAIFSIASCDSKVYFHTPSFRLSIFSHLFTNDKVFLYNQ